MSFGIVEIITILMGVSGFSVGTNPKAPTSQQALEYAVADADLIAHFDAGSVIPGNYKVLVALPNQPQIKANPELAKMVRKAVAEIDGPRGLVKQATGVDLTTDISDATAFLKIMPKAEPSILMAVHGKFSAVTIDKIAKLTGKPAVKASGAAWVDAGDGKAVGVTKTGVLVAGTTKLVQDRVADAWKAPAIAPGSLLANTAQVIDQKPVFAFAFNLSATARTEALANIKGQNFLTDVIKRHKFASFAVFRDGIGWTWIDSTKAGLDAMGLVSEGSIELMRASQIAPRGFAKIVMGAIDSYKGTNKQVDELIRRKADVWKIVETYTGDGQFKAQSDKDAKALKLTVRLTGKSLSEVLPLGGMLPMMGAWLLVGGRDAAMPPPPPVMMPPAQPMPAPAPRPAGPPAKKANPPKKP